MKIPAHTAATAAKTTSTGEKAPEIVPNAPEVAQNPVPATDKDTPVLIQYSAPEPTPSTTNLASDAATPILGAEVTEKAKELVDSVLEATKTSENQPKTGATTRIKVLKAHPRLGAFAGDTTEVPAAFAAELIASQHAVQVSGDGVAVATGPLKPTSDQLGAAESAYQRYGAVTDFKNFQGNAMPLFDQLPETIQCAWAAAANLDYSHKAE